MTHVVELKAHVRTRKGKTSRRLAREGKVPAVAYGPKFDSTPLEIDAKDLERVLRDATIGSTLVDLTIEDLGASVDVIIREVASDPVKGIVQHVDFWAVDEAAAVHTFVPIVFTGSSVGERTGGVVVPTLRELHVEARPRELPEHIMVDVSSLDIGDSLTVGDLTPPRGVAILDDPATVIVSVTPPVTAEEEAPAEAMPEVGVAGKTAAEEE